MSLVVFAAVLVPLRVEHAPVVDGRLDDAVWERAVASDAFTQKFPADGVAHELERSPAELGRVPLEHWPRLRFGFTPPTRLLASRNPAVLVSDNGSAEHDSYSLIGKVQSLEADRKELEAVECYRAAFKLCPALERA